MVNRKLVRPNLAELKEKLASPNRGVAVVQPAPMAPAFGSREPQPVSHPGGAAPQQGHGHGGPRRRPVPPDQTSAEAFYYVKQMNARTPMVVVLDGGEELRGHIEWYDRNCIKVNRDDAPNLLVFKHAIKYLFKQEEEGKGLEASVRTDLE